MTRKSIPNKDKMGLRDMLAKAFPDYCPVKHMAGIACNESNDVSIRLQASKEVAQYIYPKLKSVEHSGSVDENKIQIVMVNYADYNKLNNQQEMKTIEHDTNTPTLQLDT